MSRRRQPDGTSNFLSFICSPGFYLINSRINQPGLSLIAGLWSANLKREFDKCRAPFKYHPPFSVLMTWLFLAFSVDAGNTPAVPACQWIRRKLPYWRFHGRIKGKLQDTYQYIINVLNRNLREVQRGVFIREHTQRE